MAGLRKKCVKHDVTIFPNVGLPHLRGLGKLVRARHRGFKDIDYNSKTILEMKVMRPYSILCLKVRSTDIHSMAENPEDAQHRHRRFTQFTI